MSNSSHITINGDFVDNNAQSVVDGIDVSGASTDVTISRNELAAAGAPVAIGPGVNGVDIAENMFAAFTGAGGVSVNGAANTDITNNSGTSNGCPASMFSVAGGSTGTSIENNIAFAECTTPTPLIPVATDSAPTTHTDYDIVFDNTDKSSTRGLARATRSPRS